MRLQEQNVLMFARTMDIGGTENVVLQVCDVLRSKVAKIVVCSCGGAYVERLSTMGIKHYLIPDIERNDVQTAITVYRKVKKIVKQEKITIIHCHHRKAAFYSQFVNHKGLKIVATAHGIFNDKHILTRLSYIKIKIIACGEVVKNNLVEEYNLNNITVIRNVVEQDVSEVSPVSELNEKNGFKIAYIGRVSPEKGLEYLIKAIAIVKDINPDILYIIVGDGPQKEQILTESEKLGLKENIIYLGYRNDIQNVIKQIDAVILPSLTEGFPLSPIEAFAQGRPVISTDVGGCVEIVKNEYNGLLVHSRNEYELAEAIVRMASDKDLYVKCANNARSTYDESFTVERFQKEIVNFYENL